MTRVLVLGRNGQLARALAASAWPDGWSVRLAGRSECDLNHPERIRPFLEGEKPDVVVNTAAYTAVDRAETDRVAAFRLNAEVPAQVADAVRGMGGCFIHLSTDYVFGGGRSAAPFGEASTPAPVNVYGRSKAQGEAGVLAADPTAVVLRTSWLLSPQSGFVRAILTQALAGKALRVVHDQLGNPTCASDLAAAIVAVARARIAGGGDFGLFHAAGAQPATWLELAEALTAAAGLKVTIEPVGLDVWRGAAPRPRDSRLSVEKLQSRYGIELRSWRDWVAETAVAGLESVTEGVEARQQSIAAFQFPGEPG